MKIIFTIRRFFSLFPFHFINESYFLLQFKANRFLTKIFASVYSIRFGKNSVETEMPIFLIFL
jgi:hypothetical protein